MTTKRVQMDKAEASLIADALTAQGKKASKDGYEASALKYFDMAAKYWKVCEDLTAKIVRNQLDDPNWVGSRHHY